MLSLSLPFFPLFPDYLLHLTSCRCSTGLSPPHPRFYIRSGFFKSALITAWQ